MRNTLESGSGHRAYKVPLAVLLALAAMLVGATVAQAQTVRLKWVEAGAAGRMSAVTPHAIDLSDQKPPQIRRIPANVTNPRFGALTIGPVESPAHVNVLLDTPPGKPPRLFVDANGDGDFTNDPAPQWAPQPYVGGNQRHYTEFVGGVTIPVQYGATKLPLHLTLHRFDPGDPAWSGLKGAILYAPDYAREGDLKLGANTYHVMLLDALIGGDFRGLPGGGATGIFLLIDVNGNGVFDTRGEMYSAGQPFNIGGTTYALKGLTASGETLELVKSPVKVAEIPPPPDLRLGKIAPAFIKKATDGSTIHFPSGYGGKLVLLSFWASDCGVCTTEMPEVVKAYQFFHDAGLEIVGISLDPANVGARVTGFTKHFGMPWPEIYDGKWLQADVAELYFVHLTPTAILVEGGTGKVLATGADLRGENLLKTIAAALKSRSKSATNR